MSDSKYEVGKVIGALIPLPKYATREEILAAVVGALAACPPEPKPAEPTRVGLTCGECGGSVNKGLHATWCSGRA